MKKIYKYLIGISFFLVGCSQVNMNENKDVMENENKNIMYPTNEIVQLNEGLSIVKYDNDYKFEEFLMSDGAVSDQEVADYIMKEVLPFYVDIDFSITGFGCSTIAIKDEKEHRLFGRNFDWQNSNAIIVVANPENAYASISTVNLDFIYASNALPISLESIQEAKIIASLYAPLDGMNEKGLVVSVNMIQDTESIDQRTDKPDITTTTAVRLLLDKAATVDEAIELLQQYDLHASMGLTIHFAIADVNGRSVVLEYIDNQMYVIETPVVTNFYFAQGKKQGIGSLQSHKRYDILMNQIEDLKTMSMEDVKNALDSVSKDNFNEFESTEWSIVFNQSTKEVNYYHRENYKESYSFQLNKEN